MSLDPATARTWLFVPGSRPDRFGKALASGADVVLLDLEDAVAPDRKDEARDAVARFLRENGAAWVRVNAAGTDEHAADLDALADCAGLRGVMLPKAERAADVTAAHQRVGAGIVPLVESALGLARVADVAAAAGVVRLAFGSVDFALDLGCEHEDDALLLARSTLVLASRVAGLPGPVDGVTTDFEDSEVVRRDAERARRLGLTGKLVIHPRQLAAVRAGLAPSAAQLDWAREVLASTGSELGAVAVGGVLVDLPVLARAKAVLAAERA